MRARASIPAWAKLLAISVGALAALALLVAAPWRGKPSEACSALLDNIALVQSGAADRRVSTSYVFTQSEAATIEIKTGAGDFSGALTLDGVRSCLGPDWAETHAAAQGQSYGDAWVFTRSDAPLVMYVQGRTQGYQRVEMKIVVERLN